MDIVSHRKIFYIISGLLVGASIFSLAFWGLKLGIDFTGGSILEVEFPDGRPSAEAIRNSIQPLGLGDVRIQPTGEKGVLIRLRPIDEPTHQEILRRIGDLAAGTSRLAPVVERRFDAIGPTIGNELRQKSLMAIAIVIILILAYIAWAFRKVSSPSQLFGTKSWEGKPIKSWQYGLITIIALIHDVTIPAGLFSFLGNLGGYEADTLFVTALLTILGFSVHDTIVVFDRIRENLKKSGGGEYAAMVNASVNQTFTRSINTSATVILALGAIYFFGGEPTRAFAMTMAVGVIVGTYSSIFIASPLTVSWHSRNAKIENQKSK